MTIRAVLFDLDGTLLDRDTSLLSFVRDQYQRHPALQAVAQERFIERFIELDQHGYVWKDKVYQQLIAEFSLPHVEWDSLLQDYLQHFQRHCAAFPGMRSTLDQLKQRGVALGLISNGFGQFQSDNLRALGIEPYFDEVLISEWEALRKPDPAIFHRALSRLGVSENALFVGDHPVNDIRASKAAGMRAVWKRTEPFDTVPEADAVIDDLAELPDFVFSRR